MHAYLRSLALGLALLLPAVPAALWAGTKPLRAKSTSESDFKACVRNFRSFCQICNIPGKKGMEQGLRILEKSGIIYLILKLTQISRRSYHGFKEYQRRNPRQVF